MSSDVSKPLNPFPAVTREAWQQKVEKELKGTAFEKLVSETAEGLKLQPLYGPSDSATVATSELRRGPARAVGRANWDMRQRYASADVARARSDIEADLARGVSSLWLVLGGEARSEGVPCPDLDAFDALLNQVQLGAIGVAVDAAGDALSGAALLLALAERRGVAPSVLRGSLDADPLGTLLRDGVLPGGLELAKAQLVALAQGVAERAPGLRSVCVSTLAVHEAGAGLAQELGFALASGVTYLRWLVDAGVSVDTALAQIGFRVGIGTDFFGELCKLRALRECWGRVAAAAGASPAARHTHVHAVNDRRSATRYDPWVNLLRGTTEALSAAAGGADALTTEGFDVLLGPSDGFARRIAANAQTVLAEEAHVGRVADPGGGSYFVEHLTETLARQAWALLQEVEAAGGMERAVLEGRVERWIAPVAERAALAVARRKQVITGVSEFADVNQALVTRAAEAVAKAGAEVGAERKRPQREIERGTREPLDAVLAARGAGLLPAASAALAAGASVAQLRVALGLQGEATRTAPLVARRLAEPFERLRDACEAERARTGKRPSVFLCNLGAPSQHKARSGFASGLLSAGGLAALDDDGHASVAEAGAAFARSGATAAVICGSDAQYAELAEAAARELRSRGATQVWLAGRPGEREAALKEAGVNGFMFAGCDVLATLHAILEGLGVPRGEGTTRSGAKS